MSLHPTTAFQLLQLTGNSNHTRFDQRIAHESVDGKPTNFGVELSQARDKARVKQHIRRQQRRERRHRADDHRVSAGVTTLIVMIAVIFVGASI